MKTTTSKQNGTAKPTVIEEVEAILAELTRWKSALSAGEKRLEEAEAALVQARRKLADEESKYFAKHGQMLPDDSAPAQNFAAAQVMVERARGLCGGLRRTISDADVTLLSANEKLKFHREQYAQQVTAEFVAAELAPAQKTYHAVLHRAHALADSLGIPITVEESQKEGTLAAMVLHPPADAQNWKADAHARSLHQHHNSLRQLADQLEQHRIESVNRVLQHERERKESVGFDPNADYEVVRRFLVFGQPFEPGRKISARDVRLRLLEGLYQTKSIRMVARHTEFER